MSSSGGSGSLSHRFEPTRQGAYHVGILLTEGVSAWTAHDVNDGRPAALGWHLGHGALEDPRMPTHPASVSFVTLPEWSTLVPDAALVPGSEIRHLELVHGELPAGPLRDEPVSSLGATCLFKHETALERRALERFPHAHPLSLQALMVRGVLARAAERPTILVHRGEGRSDIAVAKDGKLLLSNTFPTRTDKDVLYFVLLAAERSGLSPDELDLRIGGTHPGDDSTLLGRYFRRTTAAFSVPWADASHRVERWMAAFDQFACVS